MISQGAVTMQHWDLKCAICTQAQGHTLKFEMWNLAPLEATPATFEIWNLKSEHAEFWDSGVEISSGTKEICDQIFPGFWNLKSEIWNLKSEVRNLNLKADIWHLTSEIWNLKSEIWHLKSEIWNLKSEIRNLKSEIWNMKNIWNLKSEIWNLKSDIWNLKSEIWNLKSRSWNLKSEIWNLSRVWGSRVWGSTELGQRISDLDLYLPVLKKRYRGPFTPSLFREKYKHLKMTK